MATYRIKAPDGTTLRFEGPDDATDEQVMQYAMSQWKPAAQEPETIDFSVSEMAGNIPESAINYGKSLVYPFLHPIETAKTLGKLGLFAVKNMPAPGPIGRMPDKAVTERDYFGENELTSKVVDMYRDRYGSVDAAKRTVMQDPVGSLADLSAVISGGGALAAKLPGTAGKVGQTVGKIGMSAEPVNLVKTGAKAAAKAIPRSVPSKLYESAAKFSTTFTPEKRAAMTETALKNRLMPSTKGVDKLRGLMGELDEKITGLIAEATKSGVEIPKAAIYRHLKEVRQRLGGPKIRAGKNLEQIDRVAKSFDEHMKALGKDTLTPDELQAFKQDAYKEINYDKSQFAAQRGQEEAEKAMARAAKESIEEVAPVKDLNREYGKLVELMDPLQRSAGRIENRNIVPIDVPLNIGAGGAVGGKGGAAVGTLASILELPKTKAYTAIKLRALQDAGLLDQNTISTIARYGLGQIGRIEQQ